MGGGARLPAFHRGSSLGTHASQGAASDQVSRSGAPIRGGVLPPAPAPVAASTSHAGHNAGRHDVRNRPGTACNSVRGRRPRPMARHASGPPPSRARTITYHNQRQCQEQRHRKDDIKRSRGIGSRTKSNRTMCAVWFLLVFVGASGQGPDLAAIDANDPQRTSAQIILPGKAAPRDGVWATSNLPLKYLLRLIRLGRKASRFPSHPSPNSLSSKSAPWRGPMLKSRLLSGSN